MKHTSNTRTRDFLWLVLFLIVFINGFEAGGYQASLWSIGKNYDLSVTSMGLFASVELFATMLAPILLGQWADRTSKSHSMCILLGLQLVFAAIVWISKQQFLFLIGVFFLGLTTSALQFISIAALADAYPVSGKKKIGYIASMYALGALISPLVVNAYLTRGLSWRTLFAFLSVESLVAFVGMMYSGSEARETPVSHVQSETDTGRGEWLLEGVLLLCVIMCIYVGFENGFTFFVDTLFTDALHDDNGKYALSLFWAVMIPSRILVGYFSQHAEKILLTAVIAIPCLTGALLFLHSGTAVMLLCIPLGLASGAIYPSVLTTLLSFTGKRTATATGMITTATGVGGVVFTALMGYLADHLGVRAGMAALGAFFIFSVLAVIGIHRLRKKHGL